MAALVASDIYPALRRFLLEANLPQTVKAFQEELGWHGADPEVRLGLPKSLKALDLTASCQLWLNSSQSARVSGHAAAAPECGKGEGKRQPSANVSTSIAKTSPKWSDPINLLGNLLKKNAGEDVKGAKRNAAEDACRATVPAGIRKKMLEGGLKAASPEGVEELHSSKKRKQESTGESTGRLDSAKAPRQGDDSTVAEPKKKKANRQERQARREAADNGTTAPIKEPALSLRKKKVQLEVEAPAEASTATRKEEAPCEGTGVAGSPLQTGRGRGMGQGKGEGRGRGQGLAEAAKAKAEASKKPRDLLQVFVGGLPFTVDEAVLRKEFAKCGAISKLNMPLHEYTGVSKGIAFITYEDEEGMLAAMKYNGEEFKGRVLKVNRGGAFTPAVHKIFVKGLPYETTEENLKESFGVFGEIENARMPKDDEGNYKGYAFVTYTDKGSCMKALELDKSDYMGRYITVKMA